MHADEGCSWEVVLHLAVTAIVLMAVGSSWYGIAVLHFSLLREGSMLVDCFAVLIGLGANLILVLVEMVYEALGRRQTAITYRQKAISFIYKTVLTNVSALFLFPVVMYALVAK